MNSCKIGVLVAGVPSQEPLRNPPLELPGPRRPGASAAA